MVRRNKISTAQLPLVGFTAPEPEPKPAEAPVPAPAEAPVPPPPEPKPPDAATATNAEPRQQAEPSRPKPKAAPENIHHHVLEDEQIVECFGTLSEALFKQQELKQLGTNSTKIESYARKGPCHQQSTFEIENSAAKKGSLTARTHDAVQTSS